MTVSLVFGLSIVCVFVCVRARECACVRVYVCAGSYQLQLQSTQSHSQKQN